MATDAIVRLGCAVAIAFGWSDPLERCRSSAVARQRLARQANCEAKFLILNGEDFQPATEVEVYVDGPCSKIRTKHFVSAAPSAIGRKLKDEKLNTIVQLKDRQIVFNEFRRTAIVRKFDAPTMDVRVFEPAYFERQFLMPDELGTLDRVPLPARDSTGTQIWMDARAYWLVRALNEQGWVIRPAPLRPTEKDAENAVAAKSMVYFMRTWAPGWQDELWFHSKMDHSLAGRRISKDGKAVLEAKLDDFGQFGTSQWWPRTVEWKHAKADLLMMLDRLEFGPQAPEAFEIVFPPSTLVDDHIHSKKEFLPGEMFVEVFDFLKRVRQEYGCQPALASRGWLGQVASRRPAWIVLGMVAFVVSWRVGRRLDRRTSSPVNVETQMEATP